MTSKEKDIESILQQAPETVKQDEIEALYEKHTGNILNVLTELWEVPPQLVKNTSCTERKWDEIRDICDSINEEYEKFMNKCREQSLANANNQKIEL